MVVAPDVPPRDGALLVDGILNGTETARRRALSAALTLLESTRPSHGPAQEALVKAALPYVGTAFRLGVTGAQGAGKSTLINLLGVHLVEQGFRVAVLVVGTPLTPGAGAILQDKARMAQLATSPDAFIRPIPRASLSRSWWPMREAILVCEAAGFDIVILETTVDSSDTRMHDMTDMVIRLHDAPQTPRLGDSANAVSVNVDVLAHTALHSAESRATRVATAVSLSAHAEDPRLGHDIGDSRAGRSTTTTAPVPFSAVGPQAAADVEALWSDICEFRRALHVSGRLETRRGDQHLAWMWERIETAMMERFRVHPAVAERLPTIVDAVRAGRISVSEAAGHLLDARDSRG